jgi:hypothetical protein
MELRAVKIYIGVYIKFLLFFQQPDVDPIGALPHYESMDSVLNIDVY